MNRILFLLLKCTIICSIPDCNVDKYYSSQGDVYVVGLFNVHSDENCSNTNAVALRQMYNIAAVVKVLNNVDYIPGITLGLSLHDACATKEFAQKSFMSSLMDPSCNTPYNLGMFTTKSLSEDIENLSRIFDVPLFTLDYNLDKNILFKIAVRLMKELELYKVDVAIFPHTNLVYEFNNLTASENMCVKEATTFSQYYELCPGDDLVVVLAVTSEEFNTLLKLEPDCLSTFIIVVLDSKIDFSSITEHLLLHDAYLIVPSTVWPEFTIPIEDNFESVVIAIEENLSNSNATADFIRTASALVSVIDYFKYKLENECDNETARICSNLTKFEKSDEAALTNEQVSTIPELFNMYKCNVFVQYLILKVHLDEMENFGTVTNANGDDLNVEFADPSTIRRNINFCGLNSKNCRNCSNFDERRRYDANYKIMKFLNSMSSSVKSNGWVFSILTICVIGVLSCVCVFAFVLARVCKDDILEGNPFFTFLLILATVLTYSSVLPFCIRTNSHEKLLCVIKLFGTSSSYCFIFSIILSRVLMILTCDYNGSFMSHINGYLQSFLCFFMTTVQLGLVVEFWIFGWVLSGIDYCVKFNNNNLFLSYMLYDTFLLISLAAVVPFVTKSRRNYKEGLCFTVVSACFILVWIIWTFGYFVVSDESKDFCVAFGLTATATAIVVCVFIPRTYLIVTGIVRDQIRSAMPSSVSNIVDMNYRSTQTLYDNVTMEANRKGESNAGYYEDPRHVSPSTSHLGTTSAKETLADVTVHGPERNYECCRVSNTSQKITKF